MKEAESPFHEELGNPISFNMDAHHEAAPLFS